MSCSTPAVCFAIPQARLRLFDTKADYLAFKSAWKALTHAGAPLSSSLFAAHAILTGRDLYKTFSPNCRPHQVAEPFGALYGALELLARPHGLRVPFPGGLNADQVVAMKAALEKARAEARSVVNQCGRPSIATGQGHFAALPALVAEMEA